MKMVLLIIFNNINIIIILMLFPIFSNFFPTLQLFFVQLCNYLESSLFFLVSLLLCECQIERVTRNNLLYEKTWTYCEPT